MGFSMQISPGWCEDMVLGLFSSPSGGDIYQIQADSSHLSYACGPEAGNCSLSSFSFIA